MLGSHAALMGNRSLVAARAFIQDQIDASELRRQLIIIHREVLAEADRIRATWPRRFDLDLSKQLRDGSIDAEQYRVQSRQLWYQSEQDAMALGYVGQLMATVEGMTIPGLDLSDGRPLRERVEVFAVLLEAILSS